jgi:hypothetical protein
MALPTAVGLGEARTLLDLNRDLARQTPEGVARRSSAVLVYRRWATPHLPTYVESKTSILSPRLGHRILRPSLPPTTPARRPVADGDSADRADMR